MFPFVDHEPEKFLAEVPKLSGRFQGFYEEGEIQSDFDRESSPSVVLKTLNTYDQIIVCRIPLKTAEQLFERTRRVGTLMNLGGFKVHMDGAMSANTLALSDEESFRFKIESFCGSKKQVHTFKGTIEPYQHSRNQSGLDHEIVEVGMIGKYANALRALFADKVSRFDQHPVSAIINLRNLRETGDKVFIQTVAAPK